MKNRPGIHILWGILIGVLGSLIIILFRLDNNPYIRSVLSLIVLGFLIRGTVGLLKAKKQVTPQGNVSLGSNTKSYRKPYVICYLVSALLFLASIIFIIIKKLGPRMNVSLYLLLGLISMVPLLLGLFLHFRAKKTNGLLVLFIGLSIYWCVAFVVWFI